MSIKIHKSVVISAAVALVTSLAYMVFAPRDLLGWEPVGILADTVFLPGVEAGRFLAVHWVHTVAFGWAVGIFTMTAIGAGLGLFIGVVCRMMKGHG